MATETPPRAAARPVVMLHVFPSFDYGGQQARFAALARGLDREFFHHVLSLDGRMTARALICDAAPVVYQSFRAQKSPLASLSNIARFQNLIADIKPHILCTYNWGAIEAVAANQLSARIAHIHFEDGFGPGESPEDQRRRRVIARRLLLLGSTVVVPSRTLADIAVKAWKLKPERVRCIANGVSVAPMQAAEASFSPGVKIGAVGALRPEKNYVRLIETFAAADGEGRATLTIVGDGDERERLADRIRRLDLEDRVRLAGATAAPERVYADFDVFALSSDTEQAPLSLMEAMAAGLPIVATDVGDIAAMVSDLNRSYVTPPGDERAYAKALARLIQNPDIRANLGAANRQKAKTVFLQSRMIDAHRELYLTVAAIGPPRDAPRAKTRQT